MHGLEGIVFIVLATFAIVQTMRCSLFKEELDVEKRWTKMRDEDQEIQKERLIEDSLNKSKTIDTLKKQIAKLKNKK